MDRSEVQARLQKLDDRLRFLSSQVDAQAKRIATLEKMLADAGIVLQPDKEDPANQIGDKMIKAARRNIRDSIVLLLVSQNKNRRGDHHITTVWIHDEDGDPSWKQFTEITGLKKTDLPLVADYPEARQKAVDIPHLLYVQHKYIKTKGENKGQEGYKFHSWRLFEQPVATPDSPTKEPPPQKQDPPPAPAAAPEPEWHAKFIKAGTSKGMPEQWLKQQLARLKDRNAAEMVWRNWMEEVETFERTKVEDEYIAATYETKPEVGQIRGEMDKQNFTWLKKTDGKWKLWMIQAALDLTIQARSQSSQKAHQ